MTGRRAGPEFRGRGRNSGCRKGTLPSCSHPKEGAPEYASAGHPVPRPQDGLRLESERRELRLDWVDRDDYRSLAVSSLEDVFRRPVRTRRIDSPTFCHGVAGLLAITMRFANETGSPVFIEASRMLVEQLLDSYQPESLLGFRNIEYGDHEVDQPGLLDGAPGVALVLLAAATNVEPTWDRLFLLS